MIYFGSFRFDQRDQTLWRGSEQLQLTRKAGAVLDCLIAAAGAWVTKEQILRLVWPDTHVQPDNIKVLIREIRLALRDDADSPRFVASQPGRGYAFVADAAVAPDGEGERMPLDPPEILVHRGAELETLLRAFATAVAGESAMVAVTGASGLGKTVLCRWFLRTANTLTPLEETWTTGHEEEVRAWSTENRPRILVIEDVETVSESAALLVRRQLTQADSRLLVIGTSRVAYANWSRGVQGSLPRAREIRLQPLTTTQVRRYLDIRLGLGALSSLAAPLRRLTGGNPHRLRIAIDALIVGGMVVKESGHWKSRMPIDVLEARAAAALSADAASSISPRPAAPPRPGGSSKP